MDDRRTRKRSRTLLQGRVVFNDRFSLIECTVRDVSDTGAQVTFAHPIEVPPEFELEIPSKGLSVRARVMWSNGKNHGVMFIGTEQEATRDPSAAPHVPVHASGQDAPQGPAAVRAETSVQSILEEARQQIARSVGVPAGSVRLKLEIDF